MMKCAILSLALSSGAMAFQPSRMGSLSRTTLMADPMTGTGPSLDYNPDKYTDEANSANHRKLGDALKDGDIERKKVGRHPRHARVFPNLRQTRTRLRSFSACQPPHATPTC